MFSRNPNASVPCQSPSFTPYTGDDGLHVPCQNVPMSTGYIPGVQMRAPGRGEWTGGYRWKDMNQMAGRGSWNDTDNYFDPTHPKEMSLGFSRKDVEYAKLSEKKNKETYASMNDRQRRLLKALESGKLFKLSKLKLEK